MNAAQVHLMLNHFPIAGSFLVVFLLLVAFIFKMRELILSGMIIAIIAGVCMIAMDLSGEGAEDLVKNKPGVTRELIHEHEEAAEAALVVMELSAVLAIGWFVAKNKKPNWASKLEIGVLVFSIVSAGLIANTAHLGGMIRHEEIRSAP